MSTMSMSNRLIYYMIFHTKITSILSRIDSSTVSCDPWLENGNKIKGPGGISKSYHYNCQTDKPIYCPDAIHCNIYCEEDIPNARRRRLQDVNSNGCAGVEIHCPIDAICTIYCTYSCKDMTVYAQHSTELIINQCGTSTMPATGCDNMNIYCPKHDGLGTGNTCIIGDSTSQTISGLHIYTQQSFYDADITTIALQVTSNIIYCGQSMTDYSCIIDATSNNECTDTSAECQDYQITYAPTRYPTKSPTKHPSLLPTNNPTKHPTQNPTQSPTNNPSFNPTQNPTVSPTNNPSPNPSKHPSSNPIKNPTIPPTNNPSSNPTNNPTYPSAYPSISPSNVPTQTPLQSTTNMADALRTSNNGKTVGYALAIVAGLLLIICCVFFIFHKRRQHQYDDEESRARRRDRRTRDILAHTIPTSTTANPVAMSTDREDTMSEMILATRGKQAISNVDVMPVIHDDAKHLNPNEESVSVMMQKGMAARLKDAARKDKMNKNRQTDTEDTKSLMYDHAVRGTYNYELSQTITALDSRRNTPADSRRNTAEDTVDGGRLKDRVNKNRKITDTYEDTTSLMRQRSPMMTSRQMVEESYATRTEYEDEEEDEFATHVDSDIYGVHNIFPVVDVISPRDISQPQSLTALTAVSPSDK